jgi:dipeptidyl aminopeptidase/acylaminoacyl peptidase
VSGTEWPDVDVVDAQSGAVVDRLDGYATPVWTNHAGRLAAWEFSGQGWVLEVGTDRKLTRLNGGFGEPPVGAATAAREDRLVAWGEGGDPESIVIWDLLTGERPGRSLQRVGDTASPDADAKLMVVFRAGEPGVATREIRTGARLAQRDDLVTAAVSPSGLVAASTLSGQLGFYDLHTLRASGTPLAGAPGVVRTFTFSRDGRLLAVVSADGAARLVDTESRTQLGEPISLGAGVEGVALRPDGLELAVPSDDSVLLWQLDPRTWQDAACRTVGRDLTREEWDGFLAGFGDYRSTCLASPPED